MQTGAGFKSANQMRGILMTAALMAACLVAFPSPANAHRGHSKHAPRGVAHGHYKHHKTVPRVIASVHRGHYSPYFDGRVYYAPHRHHHARYLFPVFLNGAVVYQPYFYCGSNLLVSGAVTLPHLAIGVHYGSPAGLLAGGYYTPGYDDRYIDDDHHDHHRGCDHDWDD